MRRSPSEAVIAIAARALSVAVARDLPVEGMDARNLAGRPSRRMSEKRPETLRCASQSARARLGGLQLCLRSTSRETGSGTGWAVGARDAAAQHLLDRLARDRQQPGRLAAASVGERERLQHHHLAQMLLELAQRNPADTGRDQRFQPRSLAVGALDRLLQLVQREGLADVRAHAELGQPERLLRGRAAADGHADRLGPELRGRLDHREGRLVGKVQIDEQEIRRRREQRLGRPRGAGLEHPGSPGRDPPRDRGAERRVVLDDQDALQLALEGQHAPSIPGAASLRADRARPPGAASGQASDLSRPSSSSRIGISMARTGSIGRPAASTIAISEVRPIGTTRNFRTAS